VLYPELICDFYDSIYLYYSTTGGGSASPVTVTSLSALKSAVLGNGAKVVIISGTITGNEVVKVGANTSILGKSGASKCFQHQICTAEYLIYYI
jgi:pectate lyase